MAARKHTIELLPQEDWEKTPLGKLLKWALGVGRYIVIITELIVILAFISRFKLDRDLTDLYEEIQQKQAMISASGQSEKDFRFLQKRLAAIEGLEKSQLQAAQILGELASLTPADVTFQDIILTGDKVNLTAIALSEQGLATLIHNFKNSPRFKNLRMTNVSLGTEQGLGIQFQLGSDLYGS